MDHKDRHAVSEAFRKNVFDQLEKVSEERHKGSYGPAEISFNRIAIMWEAYWKCKGFDVPHTPVDVAMLMSLFKMTREVHKHTFDNILDGTNYFAFAGGFNAANETEQAIAKHELKKEVEELFNDEGLHEESFSDLCQSLPNKHPFKQEVEKIYQEISKNG